VTGVLNSLAEIAANYDGIVLDQWGVLHDGTTPYPDAVAAIEQLAANGVRLGVLSNSGKRAAPNLTRISDMGFDPSAFEVVMTSGEALWRDIDAGRIDATRYFAIERSEGDAADWASGLNIDLVALDHAQAVLLMGLPDGSVLADWDDTLGQVHALGLTVYCSNPDIASPRGGGQLVVSPGALAQAYVDSTRLLMVGDSLDHDIAGAHGAGWDSVLIQGGLYAQQFAQDPGEAVLAKLCAEKSVPPPSYRVEMLS